MYCIFCGDNNLVEMSSKYNDEFNNRMKIGSHYYCRKCENEFEVHYDPIRVNKKHG